MTYITVGQRKNRTILFTIFGIIWILLNACAAYYPSLGITIGVLSLLILLIVFFRRDIESYILTYIFITTTALEGQIFYTGESGIPLYNFLNLPKMHGYHVYLCALIPWLLMLLPSQNHIVGRWKKNKDLGWYLKGILIMGILGFATCILCTLFNVNDIQNSSIFIMNVRRDILKVWWGISISLLLGEMLSTYEGFAEKLEALLYSLLLGIMPSSLILLALGKTVVFEKSHVLPIGLFFFFGTLLVVFILYPQYRKSVFAFFMGMGTCVITLIYPSVLGGKWWLVIFCIPVIVLLLFKNQSLNRKVLLLIFCLFIAAIGIPFITWYLSHASTLSIHKLNSAKAILEIWDPGWIENMPSSPKHRIDEFLNIIIEMKEHPIFLPFGKGYGGNILHHIALKPWTVNGDFSEFEVAEELFFNLHETINWIFLKSGLFGLVFTISIGFKCIKNIKYSPWIILGGIWFLFYYNNYISLSFGLSCLILGLYQADQIKKVSKDT